MKSPDGSPENRHTSLQRDNELLRSENARLLKDIEALRREVEFEEEVQREVVRDNTALAKAREEADQASRSKDRVIATLSHELRTPLAVILGWVGILRQQSGNLAQGLDVIERNAVLQLKLTEDLIDFSRIVTGNLRIAHEPVDLARIAREIAESIRPLLAVKELTATFEIEDGIAEVSGDAVRLGQILTNLLSNAIKFSEKGGTITVTLKMAADTVILSVRDSGIGISPDFLPRVFELFAQGQPDDTKRNPSGIGLGLTLVRELVELHNGRVIAESEGIGKGAQFTVLLPKRRQAETEGNVLLETRSTMNE
jgi:signal transduction histidine kinase